MSSWQPTFVIKGPPGEQGQPGNFTHIQPGPPSDDLGNINDLAIDQDASALYGPKTVDGWGNPASFRGQQGIQGIQGIPGVPGQKGDPGPAGADSTVPGPKGDKGDPGAPGADSTVPGPKGDPGAQGVMGKDGEFTQYVPRAPTASDTGNPGDIWINITTGDGSIYKLDDNGVWQDTGNKFVGAKGDKGDPGPAGADSTVPGPAGQDSTVPGPKGDPGTNGVDGKDGSPGSKIYHGDGLPPSDMVFNSGDIWIDDDTETVYYFGDNTQTATLGLTVSRLDVGPLALYGHYMGQGDISDMYAAGNSDTRGLQYIWSADGVFYGLALNIQVDSNCTIGCYISKYTPSTGAGADSFTPSDNGNTVNVLATPASYNNLVVLQPDSPIPFSKGDIVVAKLYMASGGANVNATGFLRLGVGAS